jgi:hypothetical protein
MSMLSSISHYFTTTQISEKYPLDTLPSSLESLKQFDIALLNCLRHYYLIIYCQYVDIFHFVDINCFKRFDMTLSSRSTKFSMIKTVILCILQCNTHIFEFGDDNLIVCLTSTISDASFLKILILSAIIYMEPIESRLHINYLLSITMFT